MTLEFIKKPFQAAAMGTPSAIPTIPATYANPNPPRVKVDEGFRASEGECVDQGRIHTILPYTDLDDYDRDIQTRYMDCAILENEYLRATFVLDLGGRLWSLYSKTENRELLYENPVYQPANLALRNAWFSGGVEWNIGMIGHHPFTCSPMFAREGKNDRGEPVLIMYEYERKRKTPYAVKATLDGNLLLVNVTIENPSDEPTWMYWWSNIAVDEVEGNRVIVPAHSSYLYQGLEGGGTFVTEEVVPYQDDWDVTYPSSHSKAYDYFFRLDDTKADDGNAKPFAGTDVAPDAAKKRWIAHVDKNGAGMVQFSTPRLQGRKLFVWGAQSQGGKTWNRWLSHSGTRYTEIQAGLLRSQREHCVMPAREVYTWTEAYAAYSGDPAILHGKDYDKAIALVQDTITPDFARLEGHFDVTDLGPVCHTGSGWGQVEELRRGEKLSADPALTFVPGDEDGWAGEIMDDIRALIETGHLPQRSPDEWQKLQYVAGAPYIRLLENGDTDWYTQLLLGCAYYENTDYDQAKAAFRQSWNAAPNPIAARSLGWMCLADGNKEEARDWMAKVIPMVGDYARLLIDLVHFYKRCGTDEEICDLIASSSEPCQSNGRIKMYYAQSLVRLDKLTEAQAIVTKDLVIPDMREGEVSTFNLWCDLYGKIIAKEEGKSLEDIELCDILDKYPIPAEIDFRMSYVPIKSK